MDDHSSPWCWHEEVYNTIINMVSNTLMYACMLPTQEKEGKPYHVKCGFTCKAQVNGFIHLLAAWLKSPRITVSWRLHDNQHGGGVSMASRSCTATSGQTWDTSTMCARVTWAYATRYCSNKICMTQLSRLGFVQLLESRPNVEGVMLYERGCVGSVCSCHCHPGRTESVGEAAREMSRKKYLHKRY